MVAALSPRPSWQNRNLYPPGPPGGLLVRLVVERRRHSASIIRTPLRSVRVCTPGQAMRWIRRRVRILTPLLDEATQQRATRWYAEIDNMADIVTALSRGASYETTWRTRTGLLVRLSVRPAVPQLDVRSRLHRHPLRSYQ